MHQANQNPCILSLLRRLQKRGKQLLNQQCWIWGQDIQRKDGNLLLEYGFERLRAPEGKSGSTQYQLRMPCGTVVCLWGYGIYYGLQSGLFLNRYEFIGRAATVESGWMEIAHFRTRPRSYDWHALATVVAWMASYEHWVLDQVGTRERRAALTPWKKSICGGDEMESAWQQLAMELRSVCAVQAARPLTNYDLQSAQTPYTKYSWLVAKNPRGNLVFPWNVQPSSS